MAIVLLLKDIISKLFNIAFQFTISNFFIIIKHINTDDFSVMNINCDLDKHGLPCLNDIK